MPHRPTPPGYGSPLSGARAARLADEMVAAGSPADLLGTRQLREQLGISPARLGQLHAVGQGPAASPMSTPSMRLYRRDDVVAWLRTRAQVPTPPWSEEPR